MWKKKKQLRHAIMNFYIFSCVFLLINIKLMEAHHKISTVIGTEEGLLRGTVQSSFNGKKYLAFKGVPYAKPPIGSLRFKPPQPVEKWNDVKSAQDFGNVCIQKDVLIEKNPSIIGSEDCLYLNVYTPVKKTTSMPVMVFIHWGAFITGNGNERLGPQYFMDKHVVLVTFNYRLGVFGFLSTGDDASPGNYAFKDQNAVLRWIKRNIKGFGGDPDNVTLFGQSAGAGSTHLHLLSPLSKGLFHKAISQSGSALSLWGSTFTTLQEMIAKQHATILNCNVNGTNQEIVDCLRNVDASTLLGSTDALKYFYMEPISLYTPVVEKKTKLNPEPFLQKSPLEYIREGDFVNVPWIIGVVRDEGILRVSPFLRNADIKQALLANFNALGGNLLGVSLSVLPEDVDRIWNNISTRYFGDSNASKSFLNESKSIQAFINLFSDRAFNYGSYQSVLLHASKGHKNLYFYTFDYKGKQSYGDLFALTNDDIDFDWGICHCDDLIYMFNNTLLNKRLDHNDKLMSRIMIQLWTNFATFGNPTPNKYPWRPVKNLSNETYLRNEDLHYLNISGPYDNRANPIKLEMNHNFYKERMLYYEGLPLLENVDNLQ